MKLPSLKRGPEVNPEALCCPWVWRPRPLRLPGERCVRVDSLGTLGTSWMTFSSPLKQWSFQGPQKITAHFVLILLVHGVDSHTLLPWFREQYQRRVGVGMELPTCFKKRFYLFIFREGGKEREREGEKHQCLVASHVPLIGDFAPNPGMFPDWESNW